MIQNGQILINKSRKSTNPIQPFESDCFKRSVNLSTAPGVYLKSFRFEIIKSRLL